MFFSFFIQSVDKIEVNEVVVFWKFYQKLLKFIELVNVKVRLQHFLFLTPTLRDIRGELRITLKTSSVTKCFYAAAAVQTNDHKWRFSKYKTTDFYSLPQFSYIVIFVMFCWHLFLHLMSWNIAPFQNAHPSQRVLGQIWNDSDRLTQNRKPWRLTFAAASPQCPCTRGYQLD